MSWERMDLSKSKCDLRYRDLECFNMALLAKYGWRLLYNPDTLAAEIIKEKYYPNGTFLGSNLGHKLSYAWRSIWNA